MNYEKRKEENPGLTVSQVVCADWETAEVKFAEQETIQSQLADSMSTLDQSSQDLLMQPDIDFEEDTQNESNAPTNLRSYFYCLLCHSILYTRFTCQMNHFFCQKCTSVECTECGSVVYEDKIYSNIVSLLKLPFFL